MIATAKEAMRIVRTIEAHFDSGPHKTGSAFVAPARGKLLTCAHVVTNDQGRRATRIVVRSTNGSTDSKILQVSDSLDLASLDLSEDIEPSIPRIDMPEIGENLLFAGSPQGVSRPSAFPGMVSAVGANLISAPRADTIQIAGMINNGNSGGPLLDANGAIVGIITAKYVPLLQEIDKLRVGLEGIPQFPRDVSIGQIDFSAFVNVTIKAMWQISAVLRLVQVGTGWAVPAKYFDKVGGL